MKPIGLTICLLISTSFLFAKGFSLEGELKTISEKQKSFANQFIKVVNAKDKDAFNALIHPTCVKMFNTETDLYATVKKHLFKRSIPKNYELSIAPIPKDDDKLLWIGDLLGLKKDLMTYKLRPTYVIMIEFEDKANLTHLRYVHAIEEKSKYYIVHPFPDEKKLEKWRRKHNTLPQIKATEGEK